MASYVAQGHLPVDPATVKAEVMNSYFMFCAELETGDPRPRKA